MKKWQATSAAWVVTVTVAVLVGGFAGAIGLVHSAPSAPAASPAISSTSATTHPAAAPSVRTAGETNPHPGTIQAYEPVPGGATTLDPALAYDTTSYEVILNVYQTLVAYNGSTTASMVPTLATCVPLQGNQCATDYGTGFTGVFNATGGNYTGANGQPVYWTFVIDPAAHFYDPSSTTSWKVYPSDVMFSIARTLTWSTYPYVAKTAGWILAQSLLPLGNSSWDGGLHSPYNNTPSNIYGSMLVNDSRYCPTAAMDGVHGNGCITFVADGTGQVWPEFPQFVADNLGGSVVPCGWFTAQSAGLPGWTGSTAASGDGSCLLPDGGTTTNASAWTTFLSGLGPTSWDTLIHANSAWPATQPNVQWAMVGSGPYYASVTQGLSYSLAANPAYVQPSGCTGAHGLAVYTGYCDPAPGGYIPRVDVTWETSAQGDSLGTNAIQAGTADFAGIYTTQTTTLLGYVASGIWQYILFPTLSTGFTPINLGISYSAYNTSFGGSPLHSNPLPPNLLTDIGFRNFYINAYPYTTVENTINTVAGVQFAFNAGGPIPYGMGNYYPSNVSWPYLRGDPTQPASDVGSAAWWWSQITNPSSAYYNATIATTCTAGHPCTWPIGYFNGAPANLVLINDWAGDIYNLSGHALSPWPLSLSFTQFLSDTLVGPYESPLASVVGFGWAPDYPDPTDYIAPMAQPGGSYTSPDTFSNQLFLSAYQNNASCGHNGTGTPTSAYANLTYWANQAKNPGNFTITSSCQGVAYQIASHWMAVAAALPTSVQRILDYNLIEQITNALGMYVYNGQTNQLIGFAPWIDPASVNQNPVIGGGGDIVWYQIHYRTLYTATVHETGLTSGTSWSATIGPTTQTSTANSIVFTGLANGTYDYSVAFQSGYSVSPSNGTVTVAGTNPSVSVTYAAVTGATSTVTFVESGLVTNTSWSVVVSGYGAVRSNASSLSFSLPNSASYPYAVASVVGYTGPAPGTATVGTAAVSVALAFHGFFATTYSLSFQATGLPANSTWSVTAGPAGGAYTITSTNATIVFTETNGTYNFTVHPVSGFATVNPHGSATVNGAAVAVLSPFDPTFSVTFSATGLSAGTVWTVYFAGDMQNATAPATITFTEPNGSWTFAATSNGSTATPSAGSVHITGHAQTVGVAFGPATPAASPAWTYLSNLAYYLIAVLAVLAVIGFAWAMMRRKGPPPAEPPQSWSGAPPEEEAGTTASSSGPPKS